MLILVMKVLIILMLFWVGYVITYLIVSKSEDSGRIKVINRIKSVIIAGMIVGLFLILSNVYLKIDVESSKEYIITEFSEIKEEGSSFILGANSIIIPYDTSEKYAVFKGSKGISNKINERDYEIKYVDSGISKVKVYEIKSKLGGTEYKYVFLVNKNTIKEVKQ